MTILDVIDVSKNYSMGRGNKSVRVLADLSLKVHEGDTLAILGPSGSGKSTLLSLLAGLDRPTSGKVMVKNQDLANLNEDELSRFRARHISIVFQQFHLMPYLTALENVMLPLEIQKQDHIERRARLALEEVGLGRRMDHLSSELSGGECQRVAIARALVTEPAILLADEPSGNLDTSTGTRIMNLLFDLVKSKKSTFILVTHNEELAKKCDERWLLTDGKLEKMSGN